MKQIIRNLWVEKISTGWHKKVTNLASVLSVIAAGMLTNTLVAACEDHDEMFDSGIKVGNILISDNTFITPGMFNEQTMTAVGVVFYASNDTALVIAPMELGDACFSEETTNVEGVSTDSYSLNGLTSTAALAVSGIKSPAAEACLNYKSPVSGWFLPSAGELRILAKNLNKVSTAMMAINGKGFDDVQYMSSSQDNSSSSNSIINCYCVSLLRGYAVSVNKTEPHRVRPALLVH